MNLRIAGTVNDSIVDGPGIRFTIFTQGCPHRCKGCHNPQTHDLKGGYEISVSELAEIMAEQRLIRGVTLSGGEPFLQAEALIPFATIVKKNSLNLIAYTGYYFEDLLKLSAENTNIMELLKYIDVLIDGPFVLQQKDLSIPFRGSKNQRLVDVKRSLETGNVVTLAQI